MPSRTIFASIFFISRKKKRPAVISGSSFRRCAPFTNFCVLEKNSRTIPVPKCSCQSCKSNCRSYLTRQQMEELLSAPLRVKKQSAAPAWMPLRDAAVLELFYSSGLRLSELAALDVADVDLYTESVRVFGKGRKERVCPVGCRRLRQSSVIAQRRKYMAARSSLTKRDDESPLVPSG